MTTKQFEDIRNWYPIERGQNPGQIAKNNWGLNSNKVINGQSTYKYINLPQYVPQFRSHYPFPQFNDNTEIKYFGNWFHIPGMDSGMQSLLNYYELHTIPNDGGRLEQWVQGSSEYWLVFYNPNAFNEFGINMSTTCFNADDFIEQIQNIDEAKAEDLLRNPIYKTPIICRFPTDYIRDRHDFTTVTIVFESDPGTTSAYDLKRENINYAYMHRLETARLKFGDERDLQPRKYYRLKNIHVVNNIDATICPGPKDCQGIDNHFSTDDVHMQRTEKVPTPPANNAYIQKGFVAYKEFYSECETPPTNHLDKNNDPDGWALQDFPLEPAPTFEQPWQSLGITANFDPNPFDWEYTMGYEFKPKANGKIIGLGGQFEGTKSVRVWEKETGKIIARANVKGFSTDWRYQKLTKQVQLKKNKSYIVGAQIKNFGYYYTAASLPRTKDNIRIISSNIAKGNKRPTTPYTDNMYGAVDIQFQKD